MGFLVALTVVALVQIMMTRTSLGYEIRAVGLNEKAARFKGIDVERMTVVVMLISGGIAGHGRRDRGVWRAGPAEPGHIGRVSALPGS
jgi:ABC-type uncharacterized transport system permease subunit